MDLSAFLRAREMLIDDVTEQLIEGKKCTATNVLNHRFINDDLKQQVRRNIDLGNAPRNWPYEPLVAAALQLWPTNCGDSWDQAQDVVACHSLSINGIQFNWHKRTKPTFFLDRPSAILNA
jgi:hypothetical protein